MGKYNKGDKVTIELDDECVDYFNRSGSYININHLKIIKHEPAPFDWSTVKPGMAFVWDYPRPGHVVRYIGPSLFYVGCVVVQNLGNEIKENSIRNLIRAPEHDIEVPE